MKIRHATLVLVALVSILGSITVAHAYIVNIGGGTRSLYLRVGTGSTTLFINGTPTNVATVDTVSTVVPAASLGNGTALAMSSNGTQGTSGYDGYAFCDLPNEVYIGGYNRGSGTGTLSVDTPTNLTNASGDTIPFNSISWTSTGNGDAAGSQPFPAGTFSGGTQTLASFPRNTWRESCHAFSYANTSFAAAGTYTGRVTYTLSAP